MGISTSTGTLIAGQSRTFNLSPASAVTLTLSPNVRVTITETPATVAATGLGGNASRVHEPRLPGTFTYGPYPMGGTVVVDVESNSGSSVGWVRSDSIIAESADGSQSVVDGAGIVPRLTTSRFPSQSQIGNQIIDWASAVTNSGLGTTGTTTSFLRGSSQGYSITVTGAGGRIRVATPALAGTAVKQIGLFLYNPQSTTRALTVYLTKTAGTYTAFSSAGIAVRPGAGYYTLNRGAFDLGASGGGFAWATDTLAEMQLTLTNNGAGDTLAFATGESLMFGGIFINPKVDTKAKFLLWSDDGKNSNIVPAATSIAGGDGVSRRHSLASFISSYGFTYSACIIGSQLDQTNYLTTAQMLTLQSMGVMIANHCRHFGTSSEVSGSTTGDGLRVLGPYGYGLSPAGEKVLSYGTVKNDNSLIVSEIQDQITFLEALGVTTAGHFVLPEGGFDQYVCSALDSIDKVKTVRGIGTQRITNGWSQFGFKNNAANGQNWRGKKYFLGGGVQLDVAATAATATIQAYVDDVITAGGIGQAFLHDFNHTDLGGGLYSDTATKDLCDYLVTKASTIDVVTPETIWQTMPYMQVD